MVKRSDLMKVSVSVPRGCVWKIKPVDSTARAVKLFGLDDRKRD